MTPSTTRSDNPAAVLRALLSRLPAHPPSPTKSHALFVQDSATEQERESDFDTISESNAAPSIAQESLKHIFSNALRDPGDTPRKPQRIKRKRNSIDSCEVEGTPRVEKERAKNKGKRRSVSDDEIENTSEVINRRDTHSPLNSPKQNWDFLTPAASFSKGSKFEPKTPATPGAWLSTPAAKRSVSDDEVENTSQVINRRDTADSPSRIAKQDREFLSPVASFSKGSKFEPKTPAAPSTWLSTPAVKRSVSDDEIESTSEDINHRNTADSPSHTARQDREFSSPVASFSKGSKFEPKTPAAPGAWLSTPAVKRSVSDDEFENTPQVINHRDTADSPSHTATQDREFLSPIASFSKGSKFEPKTPAAPGAWLSTPAVKRSVSDDEVENTSQVINRRDTADSPSNTAKQDQEFLTPVASFSKGSRFEPKTPAPPGTWLSTPAVKKSILKVRFEPSFSSPRRQKSPKSLSKIRVLDAFGREQEPDLSDQDSERVNSSPSALRVVDAMGREIDEEIDVEDTEAAATPSQSTGSRGELLSRIRNGLDDLVVGIDDLDKDDQSLSIDHDRVQELTTISSRARGLRERLISQADSSRSSVTLSSTKASWFSANPKVYMFLIIIQLSLIWLVYRISINRAQELWLNRYYDPFNPELHLYIFKSDMSIHVLRSEGARTTEWSSLVEYIRAGWIYFIGNMQFHFWQAWDKLDTVLRSENTWTPT